MKTSLRKLLAFVIVLSMTTLMMPGMMLAEQTEETGGATETAANPNPGQPQGSPSTPSAGETNQGGESNPGQGAGETNQGGESNPGQDAGEANQGGESNPGQGAGEANQGAESNPSVEPTATPAPESDPSVEPTATPAPESDPSVEPTATPDESGDPGLLGGEAGLAGIGMMPMMLVIETNAPDPAPSEAPVGGITINGTAPDGGREWTPERGDSSKTVVDYDSGTVTISIDPNDQRADAFYNTQGYGYAVASGDEWEIATTCIIDPNNNSDIYTAVWAYCDFDDTNETAYLIVAYRSGSEASAGSGWYYWDTTGVWTFVTTAAASDPMDVKIKATAKGVIEYTVGSTVITKDYNDPAMKIVSDPTQTLNHFTLRRIGFTSKNYGANYSATWVLPDYYKAKPAPVPSTPNTPNTRSTPEVPKTPANDNKNAPVITPVTDTALTNLISTSSGSSVTTQCYAEEKDGQKILHIVAAPEPAANGGNETKQIKITSESLNQIVSQGYTSLVIEMDGKTLNVPVAAFQSEAVQQALAGRDISDVEFVLEIDPVTGEVSMGFYMIDPETNEPVFIALPDVEENNA